jgi:hypothetical protein
VFHLMVIKEGGGGIDLTLHSHTLPPPPPQHTHPKKTTNPQKPNTKHQFTAASRSPIIHSLAHPRSLSLTNQHQTPNKTNKKNSCISLPHNTHTPQNIPNTNQHQTQKQQQQQQQQQNSCVSLPAELDADGKPIKKKKKPVKVPGMKSGDDDDE